MVTSATTDSTSESSCYRALSGDNYYKVASVTREGKLIDQNMLDVVAAIGKPLPADWVEKCIAEDRINVAKVAAQSAAIGAITAEKGQARSLSCNRRRLLRPHRIHSQQSSGRRLQ